MKVGAPRETIEGEARVAITPESAQAIRKIGHACLVEAGAGERAGFEDDAYRAAGVEVVEGQDALWGAADIVVKVRPPSEDEARRLRQGQTLISFFYPGQNEGLLNLVKDQGATAIAMDMVPRISRAQKMDALSSMANIAGYRAVIEAGNNFPRFFTGQVTAAGKVPPAKVLVIGAGVAGLSAIGTAVSLGAVVRAFDVRPEVAEQIESMGAEFLLLDFPEDASGEGGYAKPASPEFIEKEMRLFREQAPEVDIVITTALIPGRPAPKLWPEEMVRLMKRGSVVVDLAAEQGGNCELTRPGEKFTTENGVTIIGYTDFPSRMATQASTLYANNIRHMLTDLTPGKNGQVDQNMDDDVIRGATVAHGGEVTYPPPPLKVKAIAKPPARAKAKALMPAERRAQELLAFREQTKRQITLLGVGTLALLLVGAAAPASFMAHFIVFVLAVFIGFQVIWNVSHALHTPLMAVTNAISGIIVVGALLQVGSGSGLVTLLAAISILIATINIVGGFLVTRRMLAMFQKS